MTRTTVALVLGTAAAALAGCSSKGATGTAGDGVTLTLSGCAVGHGYAPVLVAVQDGQAPWKVVPPVGLTYTTTVDSSRIGVLTVLAINGQPAIVSVYYALPHELHGHLDTGCSDGEPSATGTVNSLAAGETASISLGFNATTVSGPGTKSFTVDAAAATTDLFALLSTANNPAAKVILRRGIGVAPVAPIDFTAAEAFAPLAPSLTVTGTNGDSVTLAEWYDTAAGWRESVFYADPSLTPSTTYVGIPASRQLAGDLHELYASGPTTTVNGISSRRAVVGYLHAPASATLNLAATTVAPSLSFPGTTPYPRLNVQWTMPSANSYFLATYHASGRNPYVNFYATAGYFDGSSVNLTFPDLTNLAGWQSSWMPGSGLQMAWSFYSYAFNTARGPFDSFADGQQEQYNSWNSTTTP